MAATCYLFVDRLDEAQGVCVCLDEQGGVLMPLAERSLDEIRALQANMRTVVVLSTIHSTLHRIELPWLSDKKARAAIPYALEEQLGQPVNELHFAFDRQHYRHNHYLVVVTDKHVLEKMIERLDALNIDFDTMTLDWFALREHEVCLADHTLLVNDDAFKGALSLDLIELYLKEKDEAVTRLIFRDNVPFLHQDWFQSVDLDVETWIAQRLFQTGGINLCQGALRHDTRVESSQFWYTACGLLLGFWLISWVGIHAFHLHALNQQITALDQEIASIYRVFYPNDKHVVSPEFRIRQLLNANTNGQDAVFWPLLEKFSKTVHLSEITIEHMHFQNKILSVTLKARDFAVLEGLQLRLQQQGVKVVQSQASLSKKQVLATLEMSL